MGTVQFMWDEQNFYALFKVNDTLLNKASRNTYEQDSVELFLDQNNCKNKSYDSACGQYRCNYESSMSYGTTPGTTGVAGKASIVDGGYIVEISVPLIEAGFAGRVLGVDAHINDAGSNGSRISVMKLNATADSDYTNPSAWAEVTLK